MAETLTGTQTDADKGGLLMLGARRPQVPAILAGQALGLRIIAVDPDPAAPGLALADAAYCHDLADHDAILAVAQRHAVSGIMTLAADYPMPTIAAVCAEMGLCGPAPEVVAKATNKRLMRLALTAAGVPCPAFFHTEDLAQARQALRDLAGDAVFKPAMSHGGRGITRVPADSPDEVIEQAFQRARRETRADGVLVESLVDGPEFSIETLTYRGITTIIAVTDKVTSGPPYFVELGHNQPSRWPADQVALLGETARRAVEAVGIDNAAGHTEIRLSSDGPVVMEVAARLGGGFINSHLVPLSTGIDLVSASIQVAIGATPDLRPRHPGRAAAIRFLSAPPGRITEIQGVEAAQRGEGVEEVVVYVTRGDTVLPLLDASGRLGHVICSADDPTLAIASAERAARQVRIQTVAASAAGQ